MSLAEIRPYMRDILDGLGYDEWTDGFNFENIPSTIFNESYHLEVGVISAGVANQRAYRFTAPVLLRVFLKGFRSPSEAIDDALLRGDTILSGVLAESERLGVPADNRSIKNVFPGPIQTLPFDASNDNAIILQMEFNFDLIECY